MPRQPTDDTRSPASRADQGRRRAIAVLVVAGFIGLHFQFVTIGGVQFTIGMVLIPVALTMVGGLKALSPFAAVAGLSAGFIVTARALLDEPTSTGGPGLGSAGQAAIGLFLFVLTAGAVWRLNPNRWRGFCEGCYLSLLTVAALCCAQALTGALGNEFLFNPFRGHQYLNQYDPGGSYTRFPRAAGFYLEPSFAALVGIALAVPLVLSKYHVRRVVVAAFLTVLASQSATGLLVLIALIFVYVLSSRGRGKFGILVMATSVVALVGPYIVLRLQSIQTAGSSGAYRVSAPVEIIRDVLGEYPFGRPFGSLNSVVRSYAIYNGADVGTSLDNGYYVVVYYFGWVGVIGCAIFIFLVVKASLTRAPGDAVRRVGLALVAAPLFTGAVFGLDFLCLCMAMYVGIRWAASDPPQAVRA